jgi:hypothetical protein
MACLTQIRIRRDRHALSRVIRLEWTVARLARHTLLSISSCAGIVTCGVALQAAGLLVEIFPVALEDRGGECPGMACVHPGSVDFFVALCTRRRAPNITHRLNTIVNAAKLHRRRLRLIIDISSLHI